MAYIYFNNNPKGRSDTDCVVRAISRVLNADWESIYINLCSVGLSECAWGNTNHVWGKYLRGLNFRRKAIPNMCPECYTIRDFCKDHPDGTYILATGTHVVAIIDGDYWDAFDSGNEVPQYYYEMEVPSNDLW